MLPIDFVESNVQTQLLKQINKDSTSISMVKEMRHWNVFSFNALQIRKKKYSFCSDNNFIGSTKCMEASLTKSI